MRKPFIAGNWKMHLNRADSVALARAVAAGAAERAGAIEVAICPVSVYLAPVAEALAGSTVALGAQNMHHEASGAFTGEVAGQMLLDCGCQYVILGHSERRAIFGETDADVNRKVHAALKIGLKPIVCVGEQLAEREANETLNVIRRQIAGSLAEVTADQMANVVVAYEPVWAIGTGKVATPEQAEEVHREIRSLLAEKYGQEAANAVRIQYGGSVKPDNARDLMSQPNIDGALVGGASLKANDFLAIVVASGK